jgi:predicted transporter
LALAFGILVIKSGFFPKILGVLLILADVPYLANSFTSIVLPAHNQVVSMILMPLMLGEVPMLFWLLFKGAKVPLPEERAYTFGLTGRAQRG